MISVMYEGLCVILELGCKEIIRLGESETSEDG
jgi:hypothetical protein